LVRAHVHFQHKEPLNGLPLVTEMKEIAGKVPNKDMAELMNHLVAGKQWQMLNQRARAAAELQAAVAILVKVAGKQHFLTAVFTREQAENLFAMGHYQEAEELFRQLERQYAELLGEECEWLSDIYWTLARALERGRLIKMPMGPERKALIAEIEK